MIVCDLECQTGHRFEGWFPSSAALDAQLVEDSVACPVCGSPRIFRIPSAAHLALSAHHGTRQTGGSMETTDSPTDPAELTRIAVETALRSSEDVGHLFPEKARRMHQGAIPEKSIRGTATLNEFAELADEGIAVVRLPAWTKKRGVH